MPKKEILYAAYKNEPIEDGLAYAIYLAGLMCKGLRVVLFEPRSVQEKFEDIMMAVTFAEANEHDTARQALSGGENGDDIASIHSFLRQKCDEAGISVNIHTGFTDTIAAVKDFTKKKSIDIILLSPMLTKNGSVLKRLVKSSPRPVVTMAH